MTGPLTGDDGIVGASVIAGMEQAQLEFSRAVAGLPPTSPNGPRRPIAFVICDEVPSADAPENSEVAQHLIENVRVAAILGGFYSEATLKTFASHALPNNVFMLSATASSPRLTSAVDNGLLWRTSSSITHVVEGVSAALAERLEPALRTPAPQGHGVLADGERMRVMLVARADATSQETGQLVSAALTFNGEPASGQPTLFQTREYGNSNRDGDSQIAAATVRDILTFRPHLTIAVGAADMVTSILVPVESAWPAEEFFRPRWWFVTDAEHAPGPALVDAAGADIELRKRVSVFSAGASGTPQSNYAPWLLKPGDTTLVPGLTTYATAGYDAAHVLFLTFVAAGLARPSGSDFAKSVTRLTAGQTVPLLDENIAGLATTVASGGSVDLSGASGPLDFDPTTGDVTQDIELKCIRGSRCPPGPGGQCGLQASGSYYRPSERRLSGDFACD